LLTYVIIGAAIFFGIRRIINDWKEQFKKSDEAVRQRDLKERDRPDVVELKKDEDGVFRPDDEDKKSAGKSANGKRSDNSRK